MLRPFRRTSSREPSDDYCGLKSLRKLRLISVEVTRKILEYFLLNCPLLEELIVRNSNDLETLEVSGPSLKLKHLEICDCYNTKFIKVSNTNLVSLIFNVARELELHNVPMLIEVSIRGRDIYPGQYMDYFNSVFSWLSCLLSQLEVLTLHTPDYAIQMITRHEFPELTQLKQLIIVVEAQDDRTLIDIAYLMRACPFLQKLVVKLLWMNPRRRKRRIKKGIETPFQQFKQFELSGYYGRITELKLVTYILKNATALEKITIDPHTDAFSRVNPMPYQVKMVEAARQRAKKQLRVVPQHVGLVIL